MRLITVRSDDPLYRLNQIYDEIYSAKYPNEASVIDDPLRGTLQDLYGCNLNMYDTHAIRFGRNQGGIVNNGLLIPEKETFYIYEGDGNKVLFPDASNSDVAGEYPEGILIGLLDCGFRDPEYRKKNGFAFYSQMKYIALNYIRVVYDFDYRAISKYSHAYGVYLTILPDLFAVKKCIESDIDYESFDESVFVGEEVVYCFKDKENFLKAMNTCNYAKIYKYIMAIPQITFDTEPDFSQYTPADDSVNKEFEEKYEAAKKEHEEEMKDFIENSAEDVLVGILDAHHTKFKNDLKDNQEKPGREFHVYMYNCFEDEDLEEIGLCIDAKSTKEQLDISANYIYTTNTHYVSTDLIRKGYRIFVHMSKDRVHEMKIGENDWTDREIKWAHKLETFLYNGEMV